MICSVQKKEHEVISVKKNMFPYKSLNKKSLFLFSCWIKQNYESNLWFSWRLEPFWWNITFNSLTTEKCNSVVTIPYTEFSTKQIIWKQIKTVVMIYVILIIIIITSIFSEKISPANDGLFVVDGLFVHEGLYVYVQLTYKKAWIF